MLGKGDAVIHASLGVGRVVGQWGHWSSCRECYADVPEWKIKGRGANGKTTYAEVTCPECNSETYPIRVNGEDVFDVQFQKKPKPISVNQCRLRKVKNETKPILVPLVRHRAPRGRCIKRRPIQLLQVAG